MPAHRKSCLIVVENLPVPFDRHVWQMALALREAGWRVRVVCPSTDRAPLRRETIAGIDIFRHALPVAGQGRVGYVREYAWALFHELRLIFGLYAAERFSVLHACNPPDFILLAAWPLKLFGVRFVFDQHDLSPELYESRYGRGMTYRLLRWLEHGSFRVADAVLASNETFRELAIARGGKHPRDVAVVHTIPDASQWPAVAPDRAARCGARIVIGYLGIIGFQDGVDHLVEAVARLRMREAPVDFRVVIVGDGPALVECRRLANENGLGDVIVFAGYLTGEALWSQVADFDIGVIPDPVNVFNDKLSMNKVFEYSAFGIPSVGYALRETVRMLGTTGTFAKDGTPAGLATAIAELLDDEPQRVAKGQAAQKLAAEKFDWAIEKRSLLSTYDALVCTSFTAGMRH